MTNRNKIIVTALLFSLALFMTGCGTQTKYGAVKISSTPEGAEVVNLDDSSHLGVTPAKISFAGEADTSEFVTVQLRKQGYIDRITSFWVNRRHDSQLEAEDNAIDIHVNMEKK